MSSIERLASLVEKQRKRYSSRSIPDMGETNEKRFSRDCGGSRVLDHPQSLLVVNVAAKVAFVIPIAQQNEVGHA